MSAAQRHFLLADEQLTTGVRALANAEQAKRRGMMTDAFTRFLAATGSLAAAAREFAHVEGIRDSAEGRVFEKRLKETRARWVLLRFWLTDQFCGQRQLLGGFALGCGCGRA